jgi:hypothetical protein
MAAKIGAPQHAITCDPGGHFSKQMELRDMLWFLDSQKHHGDNFRTVITEIGMKPVLTLPFVRCSLWNWSRCEMTGPK